jgi:hypothetical protein
MCDNKIDNDELVNIDSKDVTESDDLKNVIESDKRELDELKNTISNLKKIYSQKYSALFNKKYYWTENSHEKRLTNQKRYYQRHRDEILQRAKNKYKSKKVVVASE